MRKKELESLRKKLVEQKEDIKKIVQVNCKGEKEFLSGEVGDIADAAFDSVERELLFELNDNERRILGNVEDALLKIEKGTYGSCEKCGKEIEIERLKVMPFAKFCINCKSQMESRPK
ncbi:TraR/DksA family transcriptional regulator [bacterium]|nr:TraR/DksA family transcriptional regulator [bacterium]